MSPALPTSVGEHTDKSENKRPRHFYHTQMRVLGVGCYRVLLDNVILGLLRRPVIL